MVGILRALCSGVRRCVVFHLSVYCLDLTLSNPNSLLPHCLVASHLQHRSFKANDQNKFARGKSIIGGFQDPSLSPKNCPPFGSGTCSCAVLFGLREAGRIIASSIFRGALESAAAATARQQRDRAERSRSTKKGSAAPRSQTAPVTIVERCESYLSPDSTRLPKFCGRHFPLSIALSESGSLQLLTQHFLNSLETPPTCPPRQSLRQMARPS